MYTTVDSFSQLQSSFSYRTCQYASKAQLSTADMAAKLRRVIIAAGFKASRLTSRPPKKSTSSAWPGKTSTHNYESRVRLDHAVFPVMALSV
jgi:hypothetical protein